MTELEIEGMTCGHGSTAVMKAVERVTVRVAGRPRDVGSLETVDVATGCGGIAVWGMAPVSRGGDH